MWDEDYYREVDEFFHLCHINTWRRNCTTFNFDCFITQQPNDVHFLQAQRNAYPWLCVMCISVYNTKFIAKVNMEPLFTKRFMWYHFMVREKEGIDTRDIILYIYLFIYTYALHNFICSAFTLKPRLFDHVVILCVWNGFIYTRRKLIIQNTFTVYFWFDSVDHYF